MSIPIDYIRGFPGPYGVWDCPLELYTRRMLIDQIIRRAKSDYNEELDRDYEITVEALSHELPRQECDSFAYGRHRYNLIRHPETKLWVPNGQPVSSNPKPGDIVIYYMNDAAPPVLRGSVTQFSTPSKPGEAEIRPNHPTHFGIVARRSESEIIIRSKWGETDVYRHALWDVISPYGNVAIFFEPPH